MNVLPASRSSPVSTFISMSWRGRGSIIGVLVLTNCCSVVLVPAPYEEYTVSSAQQSAVCRRRGRLQLPYSPLHRPLRPWFHMAHDHQFDVCCFSLLHIHVVVPCASRNGIVWHVRPSFQFRFAPWDFVSFQLLYATLHSVRTATMDQSGFFLELVDTVVPELAVQETLPPERTRLRLGCGPRKLIGGLSSLS